LQAEAAVDKPSKLACVAARPSLPSQPTAPDQLLPVPIATLLLALPAPQVWPRLWPLAADHPVGGGNRLPGSGGRHRNSRLGRVQPLPAAQEPAQPRGGADRGVVRPEVPLLPSNCAPFCVGICCSLHGCSACSCTSAGLAIMPHGKCSPCCRCTAAARWVPWRSFEPLPSPRCTPQDVRVGHPLQRLLPHVPAAGRAAARALPAAAHAALRGAAPLGRCLVAG